MTIFWNYLIVALCVLYFIFGFIGQIDIKKRKFPNGFVESIYLFLVIFPPIIGFIFYYYYIIKANRYAKNARS